MRCVKRLRGTSFPESIRHSPESSCYWCVLILHWGTPTQSSHCLPASLISVAFINFSGCSQIIRSVFFLAEDELVWTNLLPSKHLTYQLSGHLLKALKRKSLVDGVIIFQGTWPLCTMSTVNRGIELGSMPSAIHLRPMLSVVCCKRTMEGLQLQQYPFRTELSLWVTTAKYRCCFWC